MTIAFHLSLSVADLDLTERFYSAALGARIGRRNPGWIDIWLFDAQVTAYRRPGGVVPLPQRDAMHFGATLDWAAWEALESHLRNTDVDFRLRPSIDPGKGQARMMLVDPDGYLIEIKAYRDPGAVLNRPD